MNATQSSSKSCAPLAFAAATSVLVSACYTTTNTVTVAPLKTKYPVSASGQYLTNDGTLVTEDDYQIVDSFEFQKEVAGARHERTETPLALEPELDRLLAQHQGEAITQLSISATQYDEGSHASAASWKVFGWSMGIAGGTLLLVGAATDEAGAPLMTVGGVFLGLGVVSYLLSYTANDPATWQLSVTGKVVRRSGAAVTSAEPEAALALPPALYPIWATPDASSWTATAPPGYRPLRALAARP